MVEVVAEKPAKGKKILIEEVEEEEHERQASGECLGVSQTSS